MEKKKGAGDKEQASFFTKESVIPLCIYTFVLTDGMCAKTSLRAT